MGIEIEKKLRLLPEQLEYVRERLIETGATRHSDDFEENTLYGGGALNPQTSVLRLRRTANSAILTYKERIVSTSTVKHQREDETQIEDAEALAAILTALGFTPTIVYEKRRETWELANAEVMLDELPFGLFLEIEGEESEIMRVEQLLDLTGATVEMATYPDLAGRYGSKHNGIVESRFRT